jgi:hypothetical protein
MWRRELSMALGLLLGVLGVVVPVDSRIDGTNGSTADWQNHNTTGSLLVTGDPLTFFPDDAKVSLLVTRGQNDSTSTDSLSSWADLVSTDDTYSILSLYTATGFGGCVSFDSYFHYPTTDGDDLN